ncbi:MAG TPA: MauE/DoxX family redox-associated membrane protein [Sedimentisphaerales bacterium]|nr:MauE/DoxX family redox-associated membrane protein [Sedimentisphaerales bacterium]
MIMKLAGLIWQRRLVYGLLFFMRGALGCLFIYASLPKIRQPYDFLANVYEYELVGPKLGMLAAMSLPWLELLVGICLVGGVFVSGALLVCIGMAVMFTFVIASALYRGLQIGCGCFGSQGDIISYFTLVRSCAILFVSILAYLGTIFLKIKSSTGQKPASAAIPAKFEVAL